MEIRNRKHKSSFICQICNEENYNSKKYCNFCNKLICPNCIDNKFNGLEYSTCGCENNIINDQSLSFIYFEENDIVINPLSLLNFYDNKKHKK